MLFKNPCSTMACNEEACTKIMLVQFNVAKYLGETSLKVYHGCQNKNFPV